MIHVMNSRLQLVAATNSMHTDGFVATACATEILKFPTAALSVHVQTKQNIPETIFIECRQVLAHAVSNQLFKTRRPFHQAVQL